MPRRCCVPDCRSNYSTYDTPVFSFPKDNERKEQWIRAIHRKNFIPTQYSVICAKHFEKRFLITEDSMIRPDGSVITAKRGRAALAKNAIPSIFPNLPKYMTRKIPSLRTTPQERNDRMQTLQELKINEWYEKDTIKNFADFCLGFSCRLVSDWVYVSGRDSLTFCKLDCKDQPKVIVSFKVMEDLSVFSWHESLPIQQTKIQWILGPENKCNMWSKFDTLLTHLGSYQQNTVSNVDKLSNCITIMKEIIDETCDNDFSNTVKVIWFCYEQLSLVAQNKTCKIRYSSEFLIWACIANYTSSSFYRFLRDSEILILPHPDYLRKLDLCGSKAMYLDNYHSHFLREAFSTLKTEEKFVNVLLDEIHVKKCLTYKSGQLHGASVNSDEAATTLQVFMISSLLSNNKSVVALYPVNNMTADTLFELTHQVLKLLYNIGYKVISLISDNNRINRNMFEKLCGGQLVSFIPNPYDCSAPLFLLFDSVHLLKCIRNNWLNQKNPNQTFIIPSPNNLKINEDASLLPLKEIYRRERNHCIKLAPALSEKVLFPSSFEKQNVQFAIRLFDEKNVAALKAFYKNNVCGIIAFMQQIRSWWNIVNVKTASKGLALRQEQCKTVKQDSSIDSNLIFLTSFGQWLTAWEEIGGNIRNGKLSRETFFALKHTTYTMVKLCNFLLKDLKFHYVLLGKFQTDNLESRFGNYRRMSGANYNVSVVQVMESEKKLKLISFLSMALTKSSKLDLKDLTLSDNEPQDITHQSLEKFKYVENYIQEQSLAKEDESVLVYIAGYIAHSVSKKIKCHLCAALLSHDKKLEIDIPENCQYLNNLDRGGLQWPSDFTFSVCTSTFQIFKTLVCEFKSDFLQCKNQRNVLVKLCLNYHENFYVISESCPCNTSMKRILSLCIWSMSNILLNNYTKVYNNNLSFKKNCLGRKLTTFT